MLQKKYRAIKQQRMEELEALMTEQQQRVSTLSVHTGIDAQRSQRCEYFSNTIEILPCTYGVLEDS